MVQNFWFLQIDWLSRNKNLNVASLHISYSTTVGVVSLEWQQLHEILHQKKFPAIW